MPKRTFIVFIAVILALLGVISGQAQEQTILTVVVPSFWETLVEDTDALMTDFEAQYGVDVRIDYADDGLGSGPTNADAVADYSEDLVGYLELGDVVYAEESWLSPEVTRPGYVVDLMPLINADMNLNPNDFYPAVWQSFQWDGGMWAMPTSADTLFMDYVPSRFDEVGIAYPNATWTIDDFAFAARELTEYDDDNEVELPGAQVSNSGRAALFYTFLGGGYYDAAAFPDMPSFATIDLIYILEIWNELLNEGVLVTGGGFGGADDIPLSVGSGGQFNIAINPDEDDTSETGGFNFEDDSEERALAPLPNGFAVLQTNGFAVSSGSKNPQLAYELARYLSEQIGVAKADVVSEPARNFYFTELDTTGNLFQIDIERSEEDLALIEDALYNGIPTSELRYSRYISTAILLIRGGLDGLSAVNEAEIDAVTTVEEMVGLEVNFTVIEPVVLTVADNEIVLTFEMLGFGPGGLPNQDEWDRLASEFAAQDPEVGAVVVEQMSPRQLIFGSFDCAYYPSTLIVSIDPDKMLALDPLLFSDMYYNINDLPAGVLELVQLNGFTYGIPLTVQPLMLNYNPEMFQQAGVPEPIGGWTISEFMNALDLLQFIVEEDEPSFSPQGNTTAAVLMLVLAQGGNPIDFSTDPPTLDFTSPESVAAAETVLGWAKDGLIEYGGSGGFGGGDGGPGGDGFGTNETVPIGATFFGGFGLSEENRLTTYPTGANTPVAFDVGAGYINTDMANPEACYRWMSYLAVHPYVFTGSMPALTSQLSNPVVEASIGDEAVAAYQQVADMLNDPSVLSVTTGDPFIITWLSRAFDNYVLEDADLLTELELAEQYTRDYMVCAADLDDNPTLFGLLDLQGCVEEVDSAESQ